MLYPTGAQIPFLAQLTTSNSGATGLTVTVDVTRINTGGTTTAVVTGAGATELGNGVYFYLLSSASTGTAGYYVATFTTTGTADLKKVPALEIVGAAWVTAAGLAADSTYYTPTVAGRIDVAVSSRNSVTPLDATATATATQTGLTAQGYTATRAGYLDTLNGLVAAIWASLTSSLTTAGSVGKRIADLLDVAVSSRNATAPDNASIATILTRTDVATSTRSSHSAADVWAVATRTVTNLIGATVTVADPVSSTGTLKLRAGYAYTAARGNAPAWSLGSSADLTGATGYLRFVDPTGSDATAAIAGPLGGVAGAYTFTVDVPAATTTALLTGTALRYGVEARWASGSTPVLLASGDLIVLRTP